MDPAAVEKQEGTARVEVHENPLNWPLWKRNTIFFVVCLSAFAATNTILTNAARLVIQAHVYHKSAKDLSYTLSATLAGAAIGPFVWQPFARSFGKASTIFTASNLLWIFNIWAAVCRGNDSYGSFIGARTMSGFASSAAAYGHVIPIIPWTSEDEVIRRANNSDYGLGASVWTKDTERASRISKKLKAGTVWINSHMLLNPLAPFRRHKNSGLGVELGVEGLKSYCNTQAFFWAKKPSAH